MNCDLIYVHKPTMHACSESLVEVGGVIMFVGEL